MGAEILGQTLFEALTLLLFLIVMAITLFQYQSKRFENDGVYFRHRCFWLSVAFLPILFILISLSTGVTVNMFFDDDMYYSDRDADDLKQFWHRTALWMLCILTVTFGPAIKQNRSEIREDGLAIVLTDCCGLIYLVLYLSHRKDSVSSLALLGESAALTAFAFAITLAFIGLKRLKLVSKEILYYFSFWISVLGTSMFIYAIYQLYLILNWNQNS
jgi:hypothetical protein